MKKIIRKVIEVCPERIIPENSQKELDIRENKQKEINRETRMRMKGKNK